MMTAASSAPPTSVSLTGGHLASEETRDWVSRDHLLSRVRAEFMEMPGLRLTLAQARRLFGLREDICERILLTLIAEGLLWRGADERFGLRSDS